MEYSVSCGFFIDSLYYVEEVPSISSLVSGFYYEEVLDFVKCFSCVYRDHHVAFFLCSILLSFILFMQCITVSDFQMLSQLSVPTGSRCVIQQELNSIF